LEVPAKENPMSEPLSHQVAVIGVGCTKFGDNVDQSLQDMMVEAATAASEDAGVSLDELEAAWLGTFSPSFSGGKASITLADALRFSGRPVTRVENYCATGTDAIRNAAAAVAAGRYKIVLVLGAEKLKDRPVRGLQREGIHPYLEAGSTAPGLFALAANRYMHTYGIDRTPLAKVAVKNHANGALNPKAHFRMNITEKKVLEAPMIAYPFGLFDCCPTTDGAAAAILCRADLAKNFRDDLVLIKGIGLALASGKPFLDPTCEYLGFPATRMAAAQAYEQAGVHDPVKEIDFAEVHDCFTWTEITNYEDLGLCPRGQGPAFITEGRSSLAGDFPVNPSGGLKSFGHPVGATGVRMIYEIVTQLRGTAGERQVKNARRGLAHNLGGPGAVACVVVLGRED
jgi:acetyl-CoA C-acetyltransferase